MSEVTQKLFFEALQMLKDDLREDLDERHTRLRGDMTQAFKELGQKLDQHAKDDILVDKRVVAIEEARKIEAAQQIKHGAWAGMLASAGLNAAIALFKGSWWR